MADRVDMGHEQRHRRRGVDRLRRVTVASLDETVPGPAILVHGDGEFVVMTIAQYRCMHAASMASGSRAGVVSSDELASLLGES